MQSLTRLLRPNSIAVMGDDAWCASTIEHCHAGGFAGKIWPVHPTCEEIAGCATFADVASLPGVPDAAVVAGDPANMLEQIALLAASGAGGAVCVASGCEGAATAEAGALHDQLLSTAGDMPVFGPCGAGVINFLDGAVLGAELPEGSPCEAGVAIVSQNARVARILTLHRRSLPLAYMVVSAPSVSPGIAESAAAVLEDARVTAVGLHIETLGDLPAFEALAARARALGKPIVALKTGASAAASVWGRDVGAEAVLARLGIARLTDVPSFVETLKLLHVAGRLPSHKIASSDAVDGGSGLLRDMAGQRGLEIVAFDPQVSTALGTCGDLADKTQAFSALLETDVALTVLGMDDLCVPPGGGVVCEITLSALKCARRSVESNGRLAVVAVLPELMPEPVAAELMAAGIVPFVGVHAALNACQAAALVDPDPAAPLLLPTIEHTAEGDSVLLTAVEAKAELAAYGLRTPLCRPASSSGAARAVAADIGFPVVLKGAGIAHKTGVGAVAVNLTEGLAVREAADRMPATRFLVEEMVCGGVVELLIEVVRDPTHGFVLTLAAGGTLAELTQDSVSLLLPVSDAMIDASLSRLRIAPVLDGYRGAPRADRPAILRAVQAVEAYVRAEADGLERLEINPLLCTPTDAVAVDALIRRRLP